MLGPKLEMQSRSSHGGHTHANYIIEAAQGHQDLILCFLLIYVTCKLPR